MEDRHGGMVPWEELVDVAAEAKVRARNAGGSLRSVFKFDARKAASSIILLAGAQETGDGPVKLDVHMLVTRKGAGPGGANVVKPKAAILET